LSQACPACAKHRISPAQANFFWQSRSQGAPSRDKSSSTAFRVDWMPFAGRHASGYGTSGILHTMEDMMQERTTVIRALSP
jgi:hypothetical protein